MLYNHFPEETKMSANFFQRSEGLHTVKPSQQNILGICTLETFKNMHWGDRTTMCLLLQKPSRVTPCPNLHVGPGVSKLFSVMILFIYFNLLCGFVTRHCAHAASSKWSLQLLVQNSTWDCARLLAALAFGFYAVRGFVVLYFKIKFQKRVYCK